jgi:hypothetical protein
MLIMANQPFGEWGRAPIAFGDIVAGMVDGPGLGREALKRSIRTLPSDPDRCLLDIVAISPPLR